jgi:PAS domain S-box-containing protein
VLSLSMLKLDPNRLMAVLSDVTEQDRRERQLRNTDAWLHAIMTNIADYALVSLDQRGRIAAWNDSIGRVTGHGPDAVGQPYALFSPEDATTPMRQLDRLREADDNGWSLDEGVRRRADGSQFWASAMISPLPGRLDGDSGEPAYCMIIRDISDKREISQSLRQAAYCDHLTGLSNRRAFFEAAELELARNKKRRGRFPSSCWTPTISRRSMTITAIRPATPCYAGWPPPCAPSAARSTCWPVSAARSLPSCCRRWDWRMLWRWRSACAPGAAQPGAISAATHSVHGQPGRGGAGRRHGRPG